MRGLGRILALPWLLIALVGQSLAPAEAAAMRPDPARMGICSAHGLGGGSPRPDPSRPQDHDCCAFACALANTAAVPPAHVAAVRLAFAAPAEPSTALATEAPAPLPLERPRARGPPAFVQTT